MLEMNHITMLDVSLFEFYVDIGGTIWLLTAANMGPRGTTCQRLPPLPLPSPSQDIFNYLPLLQSDN